MSKESSASRRQSKLINFFGNDIPADVVRRASLGEPYLGDKVAIQTPEPPNSSSKPVSENSNHKEHDASENPSPHDSSV